MPEGLSDGVAIEGMQQFAAAVSPGTHPAAVMTLERAFPLSSTYVYLLTANHGTTGLEPTQTYTVSQGRPAFTDIQFV